MIKRLAKWTLLVSLNAAISFFFALAEERPPVEVVAMVMGVFTFIGLYMALEGWALKQERHAFVRRLNIATGLKALTQFYPVLEVWAGIGATLVVSQLMPERGFFQVYFITLLDGLLLSVVVGALVGLVFLAERLYRAFQANRNTL
ncbi:hypothetical protein [Saccharospirillum salsuginis]|uniref:Uncharacterized protein n=1 Tax=Saccharospirillum salsuginis TaxID=418750 RepID=A0A918KS28_9GAMM|nr:hypothetical protein [Saccharospirillum salsuginis]GGX73833.1 hypothetical protein GCM10007392_46670 [Saccharospirillum salsuginis]